MKLWLLRHARVAVPGGLCYGASDLSADAAATDTAAMAFANEPAKSSLLWVSPLKRTRALADALLARRSDLSGPLFDSRLQEMDFGEWEMQAWDQIPRAAFDAWLADFAHHRFGGKESTQEVIDRVAGALQEVRAQGRSEAVWITHAGVIRAVSFLLQNDSKIIRSAEQWPLNAPEAGGWIACEI